MSRRRRSCALTRPLRPRIRCPSGSTTSRRSRNDFPILGRTVRDGKPLVYLDSGATSQKPTVGARRRAGLLRAAQRRRPPRGAPARRGGDRALRGRAHRRSPRSSAREPNEIVFTKNATEGINLVAYAMSNAATAGPEAERFRLGPGDEVVVTEMEHHANLVPVAAAVPAHRGDAELVRARPTTGRLDLSDLDGVITERTKVVAFVAPVQRARHGQPGRRTSSGGRTPSARSSCSTRASRCRTWPVDVADARRRLPRLLRPQDVRSDRHRRALGTRRAARRDAAVPHRRLDDRDRPDGGHDLRCRRRSGSRPACPTSRRRSASAPPSTTSPTLGMDAVAAHEQALTAYALAAGRRPRRRADHRADRRASPAAARSPSWSTDLHPHDVGQVLDELGIAVRVGHHCAWPLPALRRPGDDPGVVLPLHHAAEIDALAEGIER